MDIKKVTGNKIKELRKAKGYTQAYLAELIDVDPVTIRYYEYGLRFPRADKIQELAKAFKVDVSDIVDSAHVEHHIDPIEAYELVRQKLLALERLERVPDDILEKLILLKTEDFETIRMFIEQILLKYSKRDAEKKATS